MRLAHDAGHSGLLAPAPLVTRTSSLARSERIRGPLRTIRPILHGPLPATIDGARLSPRGFLRLFFTDETHLNRAGAIALSRAVAKAVPTMLDRSQPASSSDWVALTIPAGQPAESGFAIENIEESKQILKLSTAASASSR